MSSAAVEICIRCGADKAGGFGTADAIALIAALAAIVGTYAGVQAFVIADRALRAGILREEFSSHRLRLEASIVALEAALGPMRQTINPAMPIGRIEANFTQLFPDVIRAAGLLTDEARRIDGRGLFPGKWADPVSQHALDIEREFDVVLDSSRQEGVRRASATQVVADVEVIITCIRDLIEDTVKAPLRGSFFKLKA